MILQALYEYYQRKADLGKMPPYGREWKPIPYLIVIREDGSFVKLEETYEGEGKQRVPKEFLMRRAKARSGQKSWATANSLWDHFGYVLAIPKPKEEGSDEAMETSRKQKQTFEKEVRRLYELNPDDLGIAAVNKFYDKFDENIIAIRSDQLFGDAVKKDGTNMAFKLLGSMEPVGISESVYYDNDISDENHGRCLVTGEIGPIAVLNDGVSLMGASPMGAKLVGFQKSSGYDSYHKEQGLNAPISEQANFAYTTALNSMLGKGSKNHFYFSGDTLVFWASKDNHFEDEFAFFFASPPKDNPDQNIEVIGNLMKAPTTGIVNDEDDTRFYVLLLSPNVARIAVKMWEETTVKELAGNIRQYFEDLDIIRGKTERSYYTLYEILRNIALQHDIKNLPPMLFNAMVRAAINGRALPELCQMQCLGRIKADQIVNSRRAGLLKACLNRKNRNNQLKKERDITVALDVENKNQAYLCGRLFAILEKIQEDSGTSTIRERFYGAASRTPAVVFPRLLDLSIHHLAKLDRGKQIFFENQKGFVMKGIEAQGFATHFSLDDQSRFAIGYYHQRQEFYTKKED